MVIAFYSTGKVVTIYTFLMFTAGGSFLGIACFIDILWTYLFRFSGLDDSHENQKK